MDRLADAGARRRRRRSWRGRWWRRTEIHRLRRIRRSFPGEAPGRDDPSRRDRGCTREGADLIQRRLVPPRAAADRRSGRAGAQECVDAEQGIPQTAPEQKRVSSAEEVASAGGGGRAAGHVDRIGQVLAGRPHVGGDVVVPAEVEHLVRGVAPTGDVHVPAEDPERGPADGVRDRGLARPGARQRAELPDLVLGARDFTRPVAADEVDAAVARVVAGGHEATHVRHRRADRPAIGFVLVDAGRVVVRARGLVRTAEDVDPAGHRGVDGRRHVCTRSRKRSLSRPGVGPSRVLVHRAQRLPCRVRVPAGDKGVEPDGGGRAAVEVDRQRRPGLPALGGRRRWRTNHAGRRSDVRRVVVGRLRGSLVGRCGGNPGRDQAQRDRQRKEPLHASGSTTTASSFPVPLAAADDQGDPEAARADGARPRALADDSADPA